VSPEEAADRALSFLAGTPAGQASSYWVAEPALASYYNLRLKDRAPEQVGCVQALEGEQVESLDGKLRPVPEIQNFSEVHPEGITSGADTITQYWGPDNVPEHLEYEAWLEAQPRQGSRFYCPYDIRRIPSGAAAEILRELGRQHSHAVLSDSSEPAVRLLQLFVFGVPNQVPPELAATLAWARSGGFLREGKPSEDLELTTAGEHVVREFGRRAEADR
jgi:hypothetical protein